MNDLTELLVDPQKVTKEFVAKFSNTAKTYAERALAANGKKEHRSPDDVTLPEFMDYFPLFVHLATNMGRSAAKEWAYYGLTRFPHAYRSFQAQMWAHWRIKVAGDIKVELLPALANHLRDSKPPPVVPRLPIGGFSLRIPSGFFSKFGADTTELLVVCEKDGYFIVGASFADSEMVRLGAAAIHVPYAHAPTPESLEKLAQDYGGIETAPESSWNSFDLCVADLVLNIGQYILDTKDVATRSERENEIREAIRHASKKEKERLRKMLREIRKSNTVILGRDFVPGKV